MITIEIDRNECEGKANCLTACPEDVFELQELQEPERKALSLKGRIKLRIRRNKQAFAVNPDNCIACMACVDACPESAVKVTETAMA